MDDYPNGSEYHCLLPKETNEVNGNCLFLIATLHEMESSLDPIIDFRSAHAVSH